MAHVNLSGEDLDPATFHLYLRDSAFVEYFNSFLLLPAFSSRLFFDKETGYFEQVHIDCAVLDNAINVTPSPSQDTLYLTDYNLGPALDRDQSWSWIVEQRLPHFLKSDLFSEYKLCKLLSAQQISEPDHEPAGSPSVKNLSSNELNTNSKNKQSSLSKVQSIGDIVLPSIATSTSTLEISDDMATISSTTPQKPNGFLTSECDVQLPNNYCTSKSTTQQQSIIKSIQFPKRDKDTIKPKSNRLSEEELNLLASKSGMNALWKFLRGKAGEKNWLFWLDAERVKYHSDSPDQQRMLKELQEQYLHCGGPLQLSVEIRNKFRVNKTIRLTLSQLTNLQHLLMLGLKYYWCPRFMLHHSVEMKAKSSSRSQLESVFRPYSCIPTIPQVHDRHHFQTLSEQQQFLTSNYPRASTPLTPTSTPTIHRVLFSRKRSFSSPPTFIKGQEERDSLIKAPKDVDKCFIKYKEGDTDFSNKPKPEECPHSKYNSYRRISSPLSRSRKIWEAKEGKSKDKTSSSKQEDNAAAINTQFNRLAKYTLHHVPDPNSRCASRLSPRRDGGGMCENRCKILSVSGTPIHSSTAIATSDCKDSDDPSSDVYKPLIACLNTEQRKAGGYFKMYLENKKEKVYLYCLFFWREVQEYKILFIVPSFSTCAVEVKAKALYGHFIALSGDQSIDCPQEIIGSILSNLWPAYEDLFDSAEEYVLKILLSQWMSMVVSEAKILDMVDKAHLTADLEEESTASLIPNEKVSKLSPTSKVQLPTYSDKSSKSPSLTSKHLCTSLNDIMKNSFELYHFKMFLNEHLAAQDLMCWMDIEAFRAVPHGQRVNRNLLAKQIKTKYFNKTYLSGPNSPASKDAQRQIVQAGGGAYSGRIPTRPRTPVILEAQKHVRARLEKKWLVTFLATDEFKTRNSESDSYVEEEMSLAPEKKNKESVVYGGLKSHEGVMVEAITFRKMLSNDAQAELFIRYLKIMKNGPPPGSSSSSFAKNNVMFWLEVQRYKEMYHAHTTESILLCKASAIINCYFESSVPPKLQVDIPSNLAEQVSKKEKGPYIFREAQGSVFKHLFSYWLDYQKNITGCTVQERRESLDRFQSHFYQSRNAEKGQLMKAFKEEKNRKKEMVPCFETVSEKEERVRQEKLKTEIKDLHAAFRLSTPNHRYTYFTALPEEFLKERPNSEPRPLDKSKEQRKTKSKSTREDNNQDSVTVKPHPQIRKLEARNLKSDLYLKSEDRIEYLNLDESPFFRNKINNRKFTRRPSIRKHASDIGDLQSKRTTSYHGAAPTSKISESCGHQLNDYGCQLPELDNSPSLTRKDEEKSENSSLLLVT